MYIMYDSWEGRKISTIINERKNDKDNRTAFSLANNF